MQRLNPEKLHVTDLTGGNLGKNNLPRRYTLTHSDRTGDLFLTIAHDFDKKQVSGWYTKLMRDEVLAEFLNDLERPEIRVYCHVSGGFVVGTAGWRYNIFRSELPLVLEAIRYGDRNYFENNRFLHQIPVKVYFHSHKHKYNREENWGVMENYM
jgi:Staygreen protein